MALNVITEPAKEPITVDNMKNDIKVDTDLTADDTLIGSLITAARRYIEKVMAQALISQTLELTLDAWPAGDRIEIPRPPLQSITSIKYYDTDDTEATVSSGTYLVDTASEPGRVVLNSGESWPSTTLRPANAVIVRFVAGYGDDTTDIPDHLIQALRLLVGHWYENREAIAASGAQPKPVPLGVAALIGLDRVWTF